MNRYISYFVAACLLTFFSACNNRESANVQVDAQTPTIPTPTPTAKLTYEERRDLAAENIKKQKAELAGKSEVVDLRTLTAWKLGDLYAKYLGLSNGPIPPSATVSFEERMASMYHQKVNFKRCKKKDPTNCKVASDTVLSQAPELLQRYIEGDKMKMDLKKFIAIADVKVAAGKKAIDWKALCKSRAYRLKEEKCKLLQDIVKNLRGEDMVAYGMTELLPSMDGELNHRYLDVLLKSAGAQFLYHVPALGDRYASLGLYQFTFLALREDDEKVEGTSVVNTFVKDANQKLPGSVVALTGHQHHTAAFYFAVHNIASAISRTNKKQTVTLMALHETHLSEMVILVACAHHAPGYTFPVFERWLDASAKAIELAKKKGVKPEKVDIVPMFGTKADMRMYAYKSRNNLYTMYHPK